MDPARSPWPRHSGSCRCRGLPIEAARLMEWFSWSCMHDSHIVHIGQLIILHAWHRNRGRYIVGPAVVQYPVTPLSVISMLRYLFFGCCRCSCLASTSVLG